MKKQKSLEDLTHLDIFEALVFDENVQDNIAVSDDYAPDKFGNHIVTLGFGSTSTSRKKGSQAMLLFSFNPKGRLVSMEVATREVGAKKWHVISSGTLMDFTARFGTDMPPIRKKNG